MMTSRRKTAAEAPSTKVKERERGRELGMMRFDSVTSTFLPLLVIKSEKKN